ncbi:MAG: NAD(P)/FAD-dependent oxidoreductase [Bacteroidota bacterium]
MPSNDFEIAIIGAGVVGLAIAARVSERHPNIVVLEKYENYGMGTSSRNSEVIHAGIYYEPGSLKARLCVEGREELYPLCKNNDIPHVQIAKLISAGTPEELPKLEEIIKNGARNGAELIMLDARETQKLEPHIRTCGSIFSPRTGIISAHALMDYFFKSAVSRGATVQRNCEVVEINPTAIGYALTINESGAMSRFTAEKVINAAGLFSDRVAEMAGIDIDKAHYRLHYCKGSYFSVSSSKAKLISRLVYPVPTKDSLGVHALLDLGGRLKFGPDVEYLSHNVLDYSVSAEKQPLFLQSIQKILPTVRYEDIGPDMCGIRPKLQLENGLSHDFVIVHEKGRGLEGFVNLIGIDSPGLTASPAIARYVEELLFS